MIIKKLIVLLIILPLTINLIACNSKSYIQDTLKETTQETNTKTKADKIRLALVYGALYYNSFDTIKDKVNFKENNPEDSNYYEQLWEAYKSSDFGKDQLMEIDTTFLLHKDYNKQFDNLLSKWDLKSKDTIDSNKKSNEKLNDIIKKIEKEKNAKQLYGEKIYNKINTINECEKKFNEAMTLFTFSKQLIDDLDIKDLQTIDDKTLISSYELNPIFFSREIAQSTENLLDVYEIIAENPIESYYIGSINNAINNTPELSSLENCIDIPNKYENKIKAIGNIRDAIEYAEKLKTTLKILK